MPTAHNSELAGEPGIDLGLALISSPSVDDGPGVGRNRSWVKFMQQGPRCHHIAPVTNPSAVLVGKGQGSAGRFPAPSSPLCLVQAQLGGLSGQCLQDPGTRNLGTQKTSLPKRTVNGWCESPSEGPPASCPRRLSCSVPSLHAPGLSSVLQHIAQDTSYPADLLRRCPRTCPLR